jgi:hypothetical protein
MAEFDRQLEQLGAHLDYPPTPPIAQTVALRLQEDDGATQAHRGVAWRPRTARVAVLAAALLLLLAGGVVAAVPTARHALLDLVGLRGATVERVPALPDGVESHLRDVLGASTTLESATDSLGFRPLLPTRLGEPNGIFATQPGDLAPPGGELSLTYAPRPGLPESKYTGVGLLVNEVNGELAPMFFGKFMPPGSRIVRLRIDGYSAAWLEGLHGFNRQLHGFYYRDSQPILRIGRVRLTANTLLLQRGPVMVRLEGEFDLKRATAIARSLR